MPLTLALFNCVPFFWYLSTDFQRLIPSSSQCGRGPRANPSNSGLVWISTYSHINQVCASSS